MTVLNNLGTAVKSQRRVKVRLSIRKKLFFLVLVAFTALIVVTSWMIGVQATKVSIDTVEKSLKQSSVVLTTKIESRFSSINEVATGIAKDGRVLPLVYDRDSTTLQDLSHEFERVLEFDVLFITDALGEILARSDRPEAIGQVIAGRSALFDEALSGKEAQGYFVSRGQLLQIVVVPVFDNVANDVVRGTVALAYAFSPDMAQEINSLTASEIGFFAFTRNSERNVSGAQSTFITNSDLGPQLDQYFNKDSSRWNQIYSSAQTSHDIHLSLNDEDFHAVVHSLRNKDGEPLGFVMALRSRTELIKPFVDIQRMVIVIGFVCLIVSSLFAWIFALRISRPIIELVSVAKNIQEGHYDQLTKRRSSGDEVGALYNAVMIMGKNLKEKADLESYLAQMSEEMNLDQSLSQSIDPTTFSESVITASIDHLGDDPDATIVESYSGNPGSGTAVVNKIDEVIDGRYKIIRQIGSGAMGKVYLALDMDLDEKVAIKMMDKKIFSEQQSINFKEEIRLARRITHRNILRTFDFGSWQNFYYITMEYVLGYDLDELLKKKGAFEPHIGVVMAKQICSAMNAAHDQGIIHRDLKPSNMMINRQGILKIMDFGLAMTVKRKESGEPADDDAKSSVIVGTPRYMAPEQFFSWPLDERTDIYAIGIIMFSIFQGNCPYSSKDIQELAEMHLSMPAPGIEVATGDFPKALQSIIHKAMAKAPEDRYQTVREILEALNAI